MKIKVWYKLPTPPIEGPDGLMVPTQDMIATRVYDNVSLMHEDGKLVILDTEDGDIRAIYTEFDRVEPV